MEEEINLIKETIKTKIRPILVMDGGNIEYVDYANGVVSVKLLGSCHGCPLSAITLKNTVLNLLQEVVPSVESVNAIDYEADELDM